MTVRPLSALLLCLVPVLACGPKQPPKPPEPEPEPVEAPPPPDPIPAQFGALTPQLIVADLPAALEFYGNAFGAETVYTIPTPDGGIFHAEIKIGDSTIMVDPANEQLKDPMTLGGSPVTLMLYVEDADTVFNTAVDAGAVVNMPLADQFWGDRYGQLVDPFGHAWAVATHIEDLTDEQMQQRLELLPPPPKKGKKTRRRKNKKPKWASVEGTPAAEKVPAGYHTVTMSLTVSGAEDAIKFYTDAFGATEKVRMPSPDGRLIHAEVDIGGDVLMLADEFPETGGTSATTLGGTPVMIHHYVTDVNAAFPKVTESGGTEMWPLSDTFWGDRYGAVVDPKGFVWGMASHMEDLTPEQMNERMAAQMGGEAPADGGEAPAEGGDAPTDGGAAPAAEGDAAPADAPAS